MFWLHDFGMMDRFFRFDLEEQVVNEAAIINNSDLSKPTWFCFLPSKTYENWFLRKSVLPKKEKSQMIFKFPFPSVLPNPSDMRKYLDKIYEEARGYEKQTSGRLSVLGVSFANTVAYRFANDVGCSRLFSVTPGEDVPYGISVGSATKPIFREAEMRGFGIDEYRDALDIYSPENNLDRLPSEIEIHLGKKDRMVPYEQGRGLVERIVASGKSPLVITRKASGHFSTIAKVRNRY